jgi:hypothetical protein
MDAWAQILLGVLALGGPLFGYLIKVRQTAGRIKASDASQLWDEARAIRQEYAERIRVLEARVVELEGMNMNLQTEVWRLQRTSFGDHSA